MYVSESQGEREGGLTGSSVFSQKRIDLSCEPVATNLPRLLTASAQTSPW